MRIDKALRLTGIALGICALAGFAANRVSAAYPSSGTDVPAGSQFLSGDVIGEKNGWDGSPGTGASAAFDGEAYTYYDPTAQGQDYAYCGMDFGSPVVLTKVMILPRENWTERFRGGSIQGSNDMEDWDTLYVSPSAASSWDWQEITEFETGAAFRYYRYWNGEDHGDVAEIEFYGRSSDGSTVSGPVLLTGDVIGEPFGWDGSTEKGAASAFDGDRYTYYDPTQKANDNAYAGLDLGSQFILSRVRILPREGWLDRFRGGSVQGSNDLEDWTTLCVSSSPAKSWDWQVFTEFEDNTGYRYFRYWNGEEHGDVAEVQLYGYPLDGDYVPPTPATLAEPAAAVTVSFDIRRDTISSEAQPITVQPGGVYPALPGSAVSSFLGWFTLATGGDQVKEGDPVTRLTDHTLYAHYENDVQLTPEQTAEPSPAPVDEPVAEAAPVESPAETEKTAEVHETSGVRPLPIVCIAVCAAAVLMTFIVLAKKKD